MYRDVDENGEEVGVTDEQKKELQHNVDVMMNSMKIQNFQYDRDIFAISGMWKAFNIF